MQISIDFSIKKAKKYSKFHQNYVKSIKTQKLLALLLFM